jgi:hypothetical protein
VQFVEPPDRVAAAIEDFIAAMRDGRRAP